MTIRLRFIFIANLVVASSAMPCPCLAAKVPTPESHLGYRPGADFRLVMWPTVVDYFRAVDAASDRVVVSELGKTTEDRPYIAAIVSSPETIRQLDKYKDLQRKIADPRLLPDPNGADRAVEASKTVVIVTCSIHSSETASTFMAMELLHDLATKDDPATREILDNTILLLVPSANPDGVDKVAAWYERTKGKPWEGAGMPELYHKYAGHDTNRDWFMLNLKETRLLTRFLYKEWFPTLTYDVHQMGSRGARLFVPPFYDPINPNLDPRIHQQIALIGAHMASDLATAGKGGVLTHALYDNWWNGGNRTTPQRHNMVGVLTEAASVNLASPIFLEKDDLRAGGRGFPDHRRSINFVDPWPGGWWRLRDIVDYELICARSLLTLAARYRPMFQANYLKMGQDAIARGRDEPPFAWIVPSDQRDPGTAREMVSILHDTGIEVRRLAKDVKIGGVSYPEGSWLLPASQPYRTHLKDMMERQVYPARFSANGAAEAPYDVAGWTLPLQMGVRSVAIGEALDVGAISNRLETVPPWKGRLDGKESPENYLLRNQSNDDFIVLNALLAAGVDLTMSPLPAEVDGLDCPAGSVIFKADARSRGILAKVMPNVSSRVAGVAGSLESRDKNEDLPLCKVKPQKIGVYQPWTTSMDEGWTRLVLEKFKFPFATFHNSDLHADDLGSRIDVLILPSIAPKTIREGYGIGETEPAYVGGLGEEGGRVVQAFVANGGTLVCLEDSCAWAIDELNLPVKIVTAGLKSSAFFAPGSILRVSHSREAWLTLGMPEDGSVYFDRSLGFEIKPTKPLPIAATRYAKKGLLESGWLLGGEVLHEKAALVEAPFGKGQVILFGFPPQHRGQPHGTFRLFFNAILRGGMVPSALLKLDESSPSPNPSTTWFTSRMTECPDPFAS